MSEPKRCEASLGEEELLQLFGEIAAASADLSAGVDIAVSAGFEVGVTDRTEPRVRLGSTSINAVLNSL